MRKGVSLLLVLVSLFVFGAATSYAGTTERVSVDSNGNQANDGSWGQSISADGRYVAFASIASNLVPGDTNWRMDVFVHDRVTGITERVSVDSNGVQANNQSQLHLETAISDDGRYVTFSSFASNLVPGDTNGREDVFVHDRVTGVTERVSVDSNGNQANGGSFYAAISADGRYVVFTSSAGNLVTGDTNGTSDIFVHDRTTGVTERVSVDSNGVQANKGGSLPAISGAGRYVAFESSASNLVPGDTNGRRDIFVHDRVTGITERVNVDNNGGQGNGWSSEVCITGDGRYVAFWSQASNLVPGDTNSHADIFVYDRATGVIERVSVDTNGGQSNGESYAPSISDDGRHVAFWSEASTLVQGDTNEYDDIFVHDRATGETERVSVGKNGQQAKWGDAWYFTSISADGKYVAFTSDAYNLVPGDKCCRDIFVRTRNIVDTVDIGGIPDLINTLDVKNQGMLNSLLAKAENAIKLAEQGKVSAAVNMLSALIEEVEAQRGKGIDPDDADKLINYINGVIDKISAG